MEISEWVAVVSVIMAFVYFAIQQHLTRQQQKSDARARQFDRTTAILFKAMDDPSLLEAISGGSAEDQKQRRFRQVWVNHILMFFSQRHLYDPPEWKSIIIDIQDFMNLPEIVQHWQLYGQFYGEDFQDFINLEIYTKKEGSPSTEPPPALASDVIKP